MDAATKIILKAILRGIDDLAWYYNGAGQKMRLIIMQRERENCVSGVAIGNVSGGSWPVDGIPHGKQPHGTPYWLEGIDTEWLEILEDEIAPEEKASKEFGELTSVVTERQPAPAPAR